MVVALVFWSICALLGAAIGSGKGIAGFGFIVGLLLGPIGLLIVAVSKPSPAAQAQREAAVEVERARQRGENVPDAPKMRSQAGWDDPPARRR